MDFLEPIVEILAGIVDAADTPKQFLFILLFILVLVGLGCLIYFYA